MPTEKSEKKKSSAKGRIELRKNDWRVKMRSNPTDCASRSVFEATTTVRRYIFRRDAGLST
jgi:hypothetical protein